MKRNMNSKAIGNSKLTEDDIKAKIDQYRKGYTDQIENEKKMIGFYGMDKG